MTIDRDIQMAMDNPVMVRPGYTLQNHPLVVPIDFDRLVRTLELKIGGAWTDAGGAMKWTPQDWSHETRLPYILAQREPQSHAITRQRLLRWSDYLRRFNVEVTPLILALAWERGLTKAMVLTKRGRPTPFAIDCHGLYNNLSC